MTARELIHILLELNPDTPIVMMDEDEILDICHCDSVLIEVEDPETHEKENVLVIEPCFCEIPDEELSDEMELKAEDFDTNLN